MTNSHLVISVKVREVRKQGGRQIILLELSLRVRLDDILPSPLLSEVRQLLCDQCGQVVLSNTEVYCCDDICTQTQLDRAHPVVQSLLDLIEDLVEECLVSTVNGRYTVFALENLHVDLQQVLIHCAENMLSLKAYAEIVLGLS